MTDYLPLPCPCGSKITEHDLDIGPNVYWQWYCDECGASGSAKDNRDAAYLAACELINRSRMIPVEEALPVNSRARQIKLSNGLVGIGFYYDGDWGEDVMKIYGVIGWWLRPDESADLRISGRTE